jgi:hypothetical protein
MVSRKSPSPVYFRFLWRPQLRDTADEMVLETAVNGVVDRLVTFNLRHLRPACADFGIRAVTPPEAWKEIVSRECEEVMWRFAYSRRC